MLNSVMVKSPAIAGGVKCRGCEVKVTIHTDCGEDKMEMDIWKVEVGRKHVNPRKCCQDGKQIELAQAKGRIWYQLCKLFRF
jgi:hypothetical protein